MISRITPIVRNFRPLDGRAYVALIALALIINSKGASSSELVVSFLSGVLFVWYAFSINNCFDIDTDSLNPEKAKKNPVASGEITLKQGLLASLALAITGTALAYFTNATALAVYVAMLLLATMYSAPPRLKARPILDVLSHGLFFGGLPFLYGALVDGKLIEKEITMALAITIYSFALELRNHLEDYESDLRVGLRTTPIVIGKDRSRVLVDVFSLLAIGTVLYSLNPVTVLASPLLVAGKGLGVDSRTTYRFFDATMTAVLIVAGLG